VNLIPSRPTPQTQVCDFRPLDGSKYLFVRPTTAFLQFWCRGHGKQSSCKELFGGGRPENLGTLGVDTYAFTNSLSSSCGSRCSEPSQLTGLSNEKLKMEVRSDGLLCHQTRYDAKESAYLPNGEFQLSPKNAIDHANSHKPENVVVSSLQRKRQQYLTIIQTLVSSRRGNEASNRDQSKGDGVAAVHGCRKAYQLAMVCITSCTVKICKNVQGDW
jgi:hypothetical protein